MLFKSASVLLTSGLCCDIKDIEEVEEAEEEDDDEDGEGNDDMDEAEDVDESISFSLPLYLVFVVLIFGNGYDLLATFIMNTEIKGLLLLFFKISIRENILTKNRRSQSFYNFTLFGRCKWLLIN